MDVATCRPMMWWQMLVVVTGVAMAEPARRWREETNAIRGSRESRVGVHRYGGRIEAA